MKISESKLRKIIKEEIDKLNEGSKNIQKIQLFVKDLIKHYPGLKFHVAQDKAGDNLLVIKIFYPTPSRGSYISMSGKDTGAGQALKRDSQAALELGNKISKYLETRYNLEDISVEDSKRDFVVVFAVSDEFAE